MQKILEILMGIICICGFITWIFVMVSAVRADKHAMRRCFRILKYLGIALLLCIIAYAITMAVSLMTEVSEISGADGEMTKLAVILIIAVTAGIILIILLPVFIIKALAHFFVVKPTRDQLDKAAELKEESNRLKETEMQLWKEKHRRVRCPYCGTYNPAGMLRCSSCGAAVDPEKKA